MTDPLDRYRTKEHTGAMLAFVLDDSDAKALLSAVPMGIEPVSDLHLTLMYLGDTRALSSEVRESARRALGSFTTRNGPITGVVSGVGRFTNDEGDGTNALYASFDAGELTALRDNLVEAMGGAGVVSPSEHGFTPHITLAYIPSDAPTPDIDVPVLKLTFKEITLAWAGEHECFYLTGGGAMPLTVIKQADGAYRWVLLSSNSFEDRDREVVSQKALESDVARADADGHYGPLLWWHLNGKRNKEGEQLPLVALGECDYNAMHGRMLVESGLFVSESVALAVEKEAPNLEVSLGFEFPESALDGEGVIHQITRTERSLLPRGKASNRITAVGVIQKELPMLKDKLEALTKVLGGNKELVNQVLQLAETGEKEAVAAGLRTKAAKTDDDDEKKKPAAEDAPPGESAEADKPFPKAAAEDDEEPTVKKKEFEPVMAALVAKLDALTADLHILTTAQAEKAAQNLTLETRLKEASDALAAIKQTADAAATGVLELKGELPRKLGDPLQVFRPSQNGAKPSEQKVKEATPHEDPWAKHLEGFLPGYTPTPPGL